MCASAPFRALTRRLCVSLQITRDCLVRDAGRSEPVSTLYSLIYRESAGNWQFLRLVQQSRQSGMPQNPAIFRSIFPMCGTGNSSSQVQGNRSKGSANCADPNSVTPGLSYAGSRSLLAALDILGVEQDHRPAITLGKNLFAEDLDISRGAGAQPCLRLALLDLGGFPR